MGSPEFAIPSLQRLIEKYEVVGVITQPDKPAGRGKSLQAPPIKEIAIDYAIDCIQPSRLREPGVLEKIQQWSPDVIVVVAFGQILRNDVLSLPKFGCINVHGSLLPRWRGAAPIQAAILHGDQETGITIMKMDAGIDTGPILRQKSLAIKNDDTSASLSKALAYIGADLLLETLPDYLSGKIEPFPQPQIGATYASMISKEDGQLDFSKTARELHRQIRAYNPWPGSFMEIRGERIKVLFSRVVDGNHLDKLDPGGRRIMAGFPMISTSQGFLVLEEVQPAGKKPMSGKTFLNGYRHWESQ